MLGLFEGVVTGAADGYFRMKGTPASTLLHLGPGLANGRANLHNAKKARSGIVNIVGQHAGYHIGYIAPLTSDIEGIDAADVGLGAHLAGREVRRRWRRCRQELAAADRDPDPACRHSLERGLRHRRDAARAAARPSYSPQMVEKAAKIPHGDAARTLLLVTGSALTEQGLAWAERIAGKTGCTVMDQAYHRAWRAAAAAFRSSAFPM